MSPIKVEERPARAFLKMVEPIVDTITPGPNMSLPLAITKFKLCDFRVDIRRFSSNTRLFAVSRLLTKYGVFSFIGPLPQSQIERQSANISFDRFFRHTLITCSISGGKTQLYTTEASLHAFSAPLRVDMSARTISAGLFQYEAGVLVTALTFSPFSTR